MLGKRESAPAAKTDALSTQKMIGGRLSGRVGARVGPHRCPILPRENWQPLNHHGGKLLPTDDDCK